MFRVNKQRKIGIIKYEQRKGDSMQELKYRFVGVGIHEALIVQQAIEARITGMTVDLKGTEKQIKAVIEELETMYDDLNRHIAAIEREQYFYEKAQKESKDLIIAS